MPATGQSRRFCPRNRVTGRVTFRKNCAAGKPCRWRRAARLLAPLSLMTVIFYLSAQSDLSSGLGAWDLVLRKLAHVTEYAVLTALWWWALRPWPVPALPLAAAISLLYAASDEFHQTFVTGRSGHPRDVLIDAVGITIAVLLLHRFARNR